MSGEGWSCFANLPSGLIDSKSVPLTLNWLKPKPTYEGFGLTAEEADEDRHALSLLARRWAKAGAFVFLSILAAVVADRLFTLGFFANAMAAFVATWLGTSGALMSFFVYGRTSLHVMRYRRAEDKRGAYQRARAEFAETDAWRRARCEPAFWSDHLDEGGFEFESAELLAGVFATGQVKLTRATDDYGVDVLVCAPGERIVAQCKQWKGRKPGPAEVRNLAGARAYFDADWAILISLEQPADDGAQCNSFAQSQQLQYWNVEALVEWARKLLDRNGG